MAAYKSKQQEAPSQSALNGFKGHAIYGIVTVYRAWHISAGFMHWCKVTYTTERGNGWQKYTAIINSLHERKEQKWLFFCLGTFRLAAKLWSWSVRYTTKGGCRSHDHSTQEKSADGAWKTQSLVAQRRWSLFTVQFLYETLHARKVVVGSRWSLFIVIAEARFYCTSQ